MLLVFAASYLLVSLPQCKSDNNNKPEVQPSASQAAHPPVQQVPIPVFNTDSAFVAVKKQVAFGPRVPNTEAHRKCAAWIVGEFKRHGMTVIEQKFQAPHYKGGTFDGNNIIAQSNPENPRRVLIAAHWEDRKSVV